MNHRLFDYGITEEEFGFAIQLKNHICEIFGAEQRFPVESKFIGCAVSDNVQKIELGDGFPVNRNTLDKDTANDYGCEIKQKITILDKNGNKVTGTQVIQGAQYNFNSDGTLNTGSGILGIDVSTWNGNIDWNKSAAEIERLLGSRG